jgi:hypothetical protein
MKERATSLLFVRELRPGYDVRRSVWRLLSAKLRPVRIHLAHWRSSLAGVTQPLSGPAGPGDHGKPMVSQLQSRCSQAAKYAP